MAFHKCPAEVLDNIIEIYITKYPDLTVYSLMLANSRLYHLAKRRSIQHVMLSSVFQTCAFAKHLTAVCPNGKYPKDILPVRRLAIFGQFMWFSPYVPAADSQDPDFRTLEAAFKILQVVAETLTSLTMHRVGYSGAPPDEYQPIDPIQFPLLCELTLLEQSDTSMILDLFSMSALTHLYIDNNLVDLFPIDTLSLSSVRLDLLWSSNAELNRAIWGDTVEMKLIIDAPPYAGIMQKGYSRQHLNLREYETRMKVYTTALGGRAVVVKAEHGHSISLTECIKIAWIDRVRGGEGFWDVGWKPTASQEPGLR